ncbi:hypothetical protein [Algibacter amylolyticus]|uniref:hypothetical protein n=1 Tax=Algibacter amylolyticus TaxID=1608400 RepID=UPI001C8FCA47
MKRIHFREKVVKHLRDANNTNINSDIISFNKHFFSGSLYKTTTSKNSKTIRHIQQKYYWK